ncbi:Holliday junction branch migration protein RuvA [Chondromyces apiculatus]|uniref:Holliday junction branch migration complex subunit RuvA n=1 Tax=Chondromyces apiculatus DSM 436 TaxID=1192034 RepID=A0A017THN3_9BACT|nr:Holliday junction branch migration protein RuvA [Chondromyces apiculatus]EYF08086.1 Holliday junction DNA helicase RuvA [Chondromyces apiculatus DSM 436]
MIGRLTGRVVEDAADGTLVLDVAGVGYEVMLPLGALGRARALAPPLTPPMPPTLPTLAAQTGQGAAAPAGAPARDAALPGVRDLVTLFIHTHVREDAFLLYGFATREDRAAFRALISVSSIGPKIAMAILSVMSAAELATVIARKEVARLTSVSGVGKKTAERLVLELKDKLIELPTPLPGVPAQAPLPASGGKGDLLKGALTGMGYRPLEAERALTALGARIEKEPLDDLIREALGLLSR